MEDLKLRKQVTSLAVNEIDRQLIGAALSRAELFCEALMFLIDGVRFSCSHLSATGPAKQVGRANDAF